MQPGSSSLLPAAPPRRILLVKTSSLGDVVHALPVVSDLHRRFPEAQIDWVVEEAYADIPRLHPAVRRVIPVALRRWRMTLLRVATWREMRAALGALRIDDYDIVLDAQGLVKSALLVAMTRRTVDGQHCGYARGAAREPLAALFYDKRLDIPKNLHAVERNRRVAAAACGYAADLPFDYGLASYFPPRPEWLDARPYAVLLTATSRVEKLWPEEHWHTLMAFLAARGLCSVLPAGSPAERERAQRLSAATTKTSVACVAPSLSIAALASLCAGAQLVVGLDTGLTHLAVALGRPTLALFSGSDPLLTGVYAGDPPATPLRNLGADGAPPSTEAACAAAAELLSP
ncbi:MAG TPA: lipopolysaccharide heptosyltransferase I [Rhodocyclaceae bacterium]|nr:lipopolysaccharide heptosyltransferase I [Rhodocyclaceae bacterium]